VCAPSRWSRAIESDYSRRCTIHPRDKEIATGSKPGERGNRQSSRCIPGYRESTYTCTKGVAREETYSRDYIHAVILEIETGKES
jgi:hypothetical protein